MVRLLLLTVVAAEFRLEATTPPKILEPGPEAGIVPPEMVSVLPEAEVLLPIPPLSRLIAVVCTPLVLVSTFTSSPLMVFVSAQAGTAYRPIPRILLSTNTVKSCFLCLKLCCFLPLLFPIFMPVPPTAPTFPLSQGKQRFSRNL